MRAAAERVDAICRDRHVALIHAFTAPAAAAGLAHRPVMASVVGWGPQKADWQRSMDADLLERCALVTVVSEAVRAEVGAAGMTRPDLRLILHGVALDPSRDLDRVDPATPLTRIGVMAHLIERKGVDVLLRAVARLDPASWCELVIAGHGEAEAQLRSLSLELLPANRVTWLGSVTTTVFFARVDLVAVPSRSDALPLILLQAMAYGLPVVASAVGGIPEAASHEDEALLVAAEDEGALADALARMIGDPSAALRRARAARRRVARDFSLATTAAQYVASYAELCR
jgi:glycosyltransferase involved in cell wall biosynthesis